MKVERIVEDRGFGFAKHVDEDETYFFHVKSCLAGQSDFEALHEGDLLLCQTGSRPSEPGRRCIVQWIRVSSLDWGGDAPPESQLDLNVTRRVALSERSLAQLHQHMEAKWYVGQWAGEAPADLRDPLLGAIWIKKIGTCDAIHLIQERIPERLAQCRFDFREQIDPDNPLCSVKDLLCNFTVEQLPAIGKPQLAWLEEGRVEPPLMNAAHDNGNLANAHLDDADKAAILLWFVHRFLSAPDQIDQDGWLDGKHTYEAIAARHLLSSHQDIQSPLQPWYLKLAARGLLDQEICDDLAARYPSAAARLYSQLSLERQNDIRARWRTNPEDLATAITADHTLIDQLICQDVLVIDLESDGEKIWQIGCACIDQTTRLYDAQDGAPLEPALEKLSARLRSARLVIGHNILEWDWPILESYVAPTAPPLIWDTLFVQYLLDPRAPTHALGGSHNAEDDADLTLRLFVSQLHELPIPLIARVLAGAFETTADLFAAIAPVLVARAPVTRTMPDDLAAVGDMPPALILLPDHALSDLNWVAGAVIVSADTEAGLDAAYWEIDPERLAQNLGSCVGTTPAVAVLLALSQRLQTEGIPLRRSMLPLWLVDGAAGLEEAISRASVVPANPAAQAVAPFPRRAAWWHSADGTAISAMLPDGQGVLLEQPTPQLHDSATSPGMRFAPLITVREADTPLWLLRDCAAQRIDIGGGWRTFHHVVPPSAMTRITPRLSPATLRPRLAVRAFAALFPGSNDQSSYWIGVLEALYTLKNEVAPSDAATEGGVVQILLVASSNSQSLVNLLREACTTIGLAELRPSHRTRREHLRRASARKLVVIDHLENWRAWRDVARDLGIPLQPVVDALPLGEWFARAQSDAVCAEKPDTGTESPDAPPATAITEANLLEALPTLMTRFLDEWLWSTGLGTATQAPVLLDARAEVFQYEVRSLAAKHALEPSTLTADARHQLRLIFEILQIEREEAPSDLATMETFLTANWQPAGTAGGNTVSGFKPTQKRAMEAIRTRTSDVMVTLPTGEGKSVLFQVPALCRGLRNRRLTLVLSPLKALMQDQVLRLHEQGFAISVDYINSDRPRHEQADALQGVLDHRTVLLYVAPERLRNARFRDVLQRRIEADGGLEYIVFDEAHCINQWGYEFRPDYFHAFSYLLGHLRGPDFPDPTPVLLLSATLTASDRVRIGDLLVHNISKQQRLPLSICPDPEDVTNPLRAHIAVSPLIVQGNILETKDFENALAERIPFILKAIWKARENFRTTGQRSAVIIFVGRRAHADDLARRLTDASGCDVESYHAGIDAATREEIYTRFKDGDLDVLVATKAFGMGMDIPDIHWVVHLSPPTYLEDYLQEVGRIGRGAIEKRRAGLERMEALLLGSAADFESMRSLRAQNAMNIPDINEIERKIIDIAEDIENQRIAFVPNHGFEPYDSAAKMRANATKLRMALFWLEKAEHLTLLGQVPDLLSVTLSTSRLSPIAAEASPIGRIAQALLALALDEDENEKADHGITPVSERTEGGILSWLTSMIGLRSAASKPALLPLRRSTSIARATLQPAVINIAQIRKQCSIVSRDETMACLAELQQRKAVEMKWVLEFVTRALLDEPQNRIDRLIDTVASAVRRLISQLETRGRIEFRPYAYLDPEAFDFWPEADISLTDKEKKDREALLKRYNRAFLYGFRSLARGSSVRLKQVVRSAHEEVQWSAGLSSAKHWHALNECKTLVAMLPTLLSIFKAAVQDNRTEVDAYEVIRKIGAAHPRNEFRVRDLEALLRIASSLNFVNVQPDLVPLSYIIELNGTTTGLGQHSTLVEELEDINALAETRTFAMEVFANLPNSARENFITGYFAQANGAGLKAFLEAQLGEIENDGDAASAFITGKLDQLRATKADAFFKRFEQSEEPAQWAAMSHPYNQHLMVNAGPGAGKTSVLVGRVAHLIRFQHVKPSDIIVLAFNRAVVFEIRKRIRDLFRSLGYAAYASHVRVHTFHGLARASLSDTPGVEMANLLSSFTSRLSSDAAFRDKVAGGCRSILIDEFQDVSDDVYDIIKCLHQGSGERAGVMVIGDDDQDILRWQRRADSRKRGGFAEAYFDRFRDDFGGDTLQTLQLSVNFRSEASVVDLSQSMISGFFKANTRSRRLKTSLLRPSSSAGQGHCDRIITTDWDRHRVLSSVVDMSQHLIAENPGSLAVLCRTNDEVAEVHRALSTVFPQITVQSSENMRIADLRHVALWCEFLEDSLASSDRALSPTLREELLQGFRASVAIPETANAAEGDVELGTLWDLCCGESVFPHLSTLLRFIRNLQRDELLRLTGQYGASHEVVVSTIHKVKGLEYDNVVIVPSRASFGDTTAGAEALEEDAAEEARLLYVALTRAKSRLVNFIGPREYAWARAQPRYQAGAEGGDKVLTGAHNQIALGWAFRRTSFNPDPDNCQEYIERQVVVGDRLKLGGVGSRRGMTLIHIDRTGAERQIGCLASRMGSGAAGADLRVSAVIRYPIDIRDQGAVGVLCAARGWGYAVLVAGRLR
ncbi:UvrD-helicase domain-containing protein [Pseudogemmobacter faecipullorum]|uniref:DNA 3'-5' helicase n=1 Tax=Pseudogemmobacter faecipullorum TaxID=2755041 RepID=A0ABS8CRN1_9RHOB|nr:UvrD-helicase domain-containing protein [Pseudogemmobacter faecipullorum]MCB5412052.1 UvrD-helicase domain-containing protein [Pseudogemmobacter faecipullorum]